MIIQPAELIDRLIAAYNRQDIRAFIDCYAHDVEVYALGDNDPTLHGAAQVHATYAKAFADNPLLHAEVLQRTTLGDVVVDHERITGRSSGDPLEAIVIYRVVQGQIAQVWFTGKG